MQDFAALLVDARKRSGLTQAQLAVSAGLTPSYLSFIENRKKPPPSDEICRRLAKVLGMPEKTVLDVAHMERAPESLQKRLKALTHSLRRERKSRKRLLTSLLSPFLFAGPPGYRESALETMDLTPMRKRRIKEVLAAVGRRHQDQEKEVSRIVDELPERERSQLLAKLAEMVAHERADKKRRNRVAPPLLTDAPRPGDDVESPYLLEVTEPAAEGMDDLRAGDRILVDIRLRPALDDMLVLAGQAGFHVRRLVASGDGFRLTTDGADKGDELTAHELGARLDQVCSGTVIEVRRPLRRRA